MLGLAGLWIGAIHERVLNSSTAEHTPTHRVPAALDGEARGEPAPVREGAVKSDEPRQHYAEHLTGGRERAYAAECRKPCCRAHVHLRVGGRSGL
jgi:hypothetical protein